jgi:hypothetical protein
VLLAAHLGMQACPHSTAEDVRHLNGVTAIILLQHLHAAQRYANR